MRRVALAVAAAALVFSAGAAAKHGHHGDSGHHHGKGSGQQAYRPSAGDVYTGVSDTGELDQFAGSARQLGAHPAVLESFHYWGVNPAEAMKRWRATKTRGMISVSTTKSYGGGELINPKQIAMGKGDHYPLNLNTSIDRYKRPVYIRLLPEMNGYWNPYCAFNQNGSSRGGDHSARFYKLAWRRFALIIRGGPVKKINHKLHSLHLPAIKASHLPKVLPRPKVALVWVPQWQGSPATAANSPRAYYPGNDYVDWVGLDTYERYQNFDAMSAFYKAFPDKPFAITEWSPWASDSPDFARNLFHWIRGHNRAEMEIYYRGFLKDDPFELGHYPKARAKVQAALNGKTFLAYAPEWKPAQKPQPLPPPPPPSDVDPQPAPILPPIL